MTKPQQSALKVIAHQASPEIEVTAYMVDAGLEALREHHYGGDDRYMLECVYRAMDYARSRASATNASR